MLRQLGALSSLSKPDGAWRQAPYCPTWAMCPHTAGACDATSWVLPSRSGDFLCRSTPLARQEDGLLALHVRAIASGQRLFGSVVMCGRKGEGAGPGEGKRGPCYELILVPVNRPVCWAQFKQPLRLHGCCGRGCICPSLVLMWAASGFTVLACGHVPKSYRETGPGPPSGQSSAWKAPAESP